jgi:hypothetical protein
MKSIVATTSFAAVFFVATSAFAGHPLQPNGWPVPASQTPTLSDEQIEHREFMNVLRETFPNNAPSSQMVSERSAKSAKRIGGHTHR